METLRVGSWTRASLLEARMEPSILRGFGQFQRPSQFQCFKLRVRGFQWE